MTYDSVTSDVNRLAKSKNFTMFYKDLNANSLPQWIFITPNMSAFLSRFYFISFILVPNNTNSADLDSKRRPR